MAEIHNLVGDVYFAIKKIALVWGQNKETMNDSKMKDIGLNIIMPISSFGERFIEQSDDLISALNKLKEEGILDDL